MDRTNKATDPAHEATDRNIVGVERRSNIWYNIAQRNIEKVLSAYFALFKEQDEKMRAELSEQDYIQWRLKTILRAKYFNPVRDDVADKLYEANARAALETEGAMEDTIEKNWTQEAEEIEADEKDKGIKFPVLTVAAIALILKNKDRPRVNKRKDLTWNRRQITAAVTSGIVQGTPIDGLCVATVKIVVQRNKRTAWTNARTFMTTAETKARQAVYDAADKMGLKRVKTWYTVGDGKVRDEHAQMEGVTVPATEPFIVDGYPMIGPGDRSAPARLWYNCRCRMKSSKEGA